MQGSFDFSTLFIWKNQHYEYIKFGLVLYMEQRSLEKIDSPCRGKGEIYNITHYSLQRDEVFSRIGNF